MCNKRWLPVRCRYACDVLDHPQLSVLELDHLDKEYMLVHARLCLLQNDPDPSHMIGELVYLFHSLMFNYYVPQMLIYCYNQVQHRLQRRP